MQRITIGIIAAILFIVVGVTIAMIVLKIRQIRRRKLARRRHEASQEMVQRTGTVRSLGSNDEGLETVDVYGYGPVRTRPVIVAPAPRTPFYQLHINTERVSPITSWLRRRDSDDDTLNTTTPLIERHRNEDRASRLTSASNLSLPSLFSYEVSPFTPAAESSDMYPGDSPESEQRRVPPVDRDHYNTVALRDDGLPVGCHAPDSRYAAP
ncbi:hypothetical protein C8J56DRAFT_256371 [Mycena floridula]|nr:hypothetical protein C8J56DRAFT_256371 [Mycena floridula]